MKMIRNLHWHIPFRNIDDDDDIDCLLELDLNLPLYQFSAFVTLSLFSCQTNHNHYFSKFSAKD